METELRRIQFELRARFRCSVRSIVAYLVASFYVTTPFWMYVSVALEVCNAATAYQYARECSWITHVGMLCAGYVFQDVRVVILALVHPIDDSLPIARNTKCMPFLQAVQQHPFFNLCALLQRGWLITNAEHYARTRGQSNRFFGLVIGWRLFQWPLESLVLPNEDRGLELQPTFEDEMPEWVWLEEVSADSLWKDGFLFCGWTLATIGVFSYNVLYVMFALGVTTTVSVFWFHARIHRGLLAWLWVCVAALLNEWCVAATWAVLAWKYMQLYPPRDVVQFLVRGVAYQTRARTCIDRPLCVDVPFSVQEAWQVN